MRIISPFAIAKGLARAYTLAKKNASSLDNISRKAYNSRKFTQRDFMTKEEIEKKIEFWKKRMREKNSQQLAEERKKRVRASCTAIGEMEKLVGKKLDYEKFVGDFVTFIKGQEERGKFISKSFHWQEPATKKPTTAPAPKSEPKTQNLTSENKSQKTQ